MTADTHAHDAFRSALRAGIDRDLARSRSHRRRGLRALALTPVALAAALVLVLAQPFDHGQSAIAKARAALDRMPQTGILHELARGADGTVGEEVWQSLSNPREYRRWEAEPTGGPEESAVADGVSMRFDAAANTIYTQRVIESTGAFSETINLPAVRRLLAIPRSRDLGVETLAGRQVRHLELPPAPGSPDTTCEYFADAVTFLPVRMQCSDAGRTTAVTTYAFLADDAADRAQFALTSIHPSAAVKQDPNGIPGAAGDDLAAVTASGVIDVTAGKELLQQTSEDAMRSARELEASLGREWLGCYADHGAYSVTNANGETSPHDPTGTVGAICQHYGDSANAVRATPAGAALRARELADVKDVNACFEARHPSAAERTSAWDACRGEHPDAFLASLPNPA
jgi:hypothetical protein